MQAATLVHHTLQLHACAAPKSVWPTHKEAVSKLLHIRLQSGQHCCLLRYKACGSEQHTRSHDFHYTVEARQMAPNLHTQHDN